MKSSSSSIFTWTVVFAVIMLFTTENGVNGLKCNICGVTKSKHPPCKVMPCNSVRDVNHAMNYVTKQHGLGDLFPELIDKRKHFVCVRLAGKAKSGKTAFISSHCAPRNANHPPSTRHYSLNAYAMEELDAMTKGRPDAFILTEIIEKLHGDVYVCDDKVGNGPNCGENATVALKH